MSWQERLREDARGILAAGVEAVEPRALVRDYLEEHPEALPGSAPVRIAGIGKAAVAMARGAAEALEGRVAGGVLVAAAGTTGEAPDGLEVFEGGHPVPNARGVEGAGAVHELAAGLGEGELLLTLISGGGSALMTLPPDGVSLEDVQATTSALLRAGATINDLNAVRKHLDRLKGGRLARTAAPARVLALVLSDVVGDPLDVIASGPVSPDPSTWEEAAGVLRRFGVWDGLPGAVRAHVELGLAGDEPDSPKRGDPCFDGAEARVIGSNRIAAEAAAAAARERGYGTLLLTTLLTGEAREAGAFLAAIGREIERHGRPLAAPACILTAGETTVTVRGDGTGGRNQELALGAALALDGSERILAAAMGTDGIDGPTDAAGAVADGRTVARAAEAGRDARRALADNDAHPFFEALDDLIVTGPTGTNVMDLMLVLVGGDGLSRSREPNRGTGEKERIRSV